VELQGHWTGQRLYDAATGPKEFWLVPGAGHADGQKTHPDEYRERVLRFFRIYLG